MKAKPNHINRPRQKVIQTFIKSSFPIPFSRWVQVLLGLVFLFAAGAKGYDLVRFGRQTEAIISTLGFERTPLLSSIAFALATAVLLLELYLGASLITGYNSSDSSVISILLLIVFSGIALWAILGEENFDCGCFGTAVSRSAREALAENLLLLIMAFIGAASKFSTTRGKTISQAILLTGFLGIGYFYFFPSAGSALREGSVMPRATLSAYGVSSSTRYLWVFNPDCGVCQRLLPAIKVIASSTPSSVAGLAAASSGRVEEFIYDYKIDFPVHEITTDQMRQMGVQDGTLIRLAQGKVDRIWLPYMLEQIIHLDLLK